MSTHFNLGLTTDYAPLQQALDGAWLSLGQFVKPKRGPQGKVRTHFDLLMLNIIDTQGDVLLVSLDHNHYAANRYNPLSVTKAIAKMFERLAGAGLVSLEIGSYAEGTRTELTPSAELVAMFDTVELPVGSIKDISESVCLRAEDDKGFIDYEDSYRTESWREQLTRYNDALAETHLWLRDRDDPSKGELLSGTATHYRIFNRGSFECGGRMYSKRLQSLPKADRKRLYIDGERTIEPDFKGLHISMAYAKEGLDCIGDPYAFFKGVPQQAEDTRKATRSDAKALALVAINATSRQGAAQAFRDKVEDGLSNKTRRALWDAMTAQHSAIANYFGSDSGIRFQRHDSDIMLLALSTLLDQGVVAVPVHDSVVVAQKHEQTAIKVLKQAAEAVLADAGYRVRLTVEQPDLTYDVLIANALVQDLQQWHTEDRTVAEVIGHVKSVPVDKVLRLRTASL